MKQHSFSRSELLIQEDGLNTLKNSTIMVVGIGGVGSYCAEALARSGVGKIILIDDDTICLTNLNRQVHATTSTVGKNKVDAMKERILDINPKCDVVSINTFIDKENIPTLLTGKIDYVVDAIDTITSKLDLIEYSIDNNIPIVSCLGTGNKFDPTAFKMTDIYKTKVCPLAKVMRYELKKRRIKKLRVLFSEEIPTKPKTNDVVNCKNGCVCVGGSKKCTIRRQIPGSMSYVPPVAGMILAGDVVNSLLSCNKN